MTQFEFREFAALNPWHDEIHAKKGSGTPMWYPTERQWVAIWFAYVGVTLFLLAGTRTPSLWYRIAMIFVLGITVNVWRHSRKYPPH